MLRIKDCATHMYTHTDAHNKNQCWGSYFENIACEATNYFTLEVVETTAKLPWEKCSFGNYKLHRKCSSNYFVKEKCRHNA